jgi:hypothetical protein
MPVSAEDRALQTFITAILLALAAVLAAVLARDAGAAWTSIMHWAGEIVLVVGLWLVATGHAARPDWAVWLVSWRGSDPADAEVAVAYSEQSSLSRLLRGAQIGMRGTATSAGPLPYAEPGEPDPEAAADPLEREPAAWPLRDGTASRAAPAVHRYAWGVGCLVLGVLVTAIFW